jgi:pSer/pThr/pTyr-binding forkhead associated (FHA) protein
VPAATRVRAVGTTEAEKPEQDESPVLYLTKDGRTLKKIIFAGARLLVGRSEHNDLCIDSTFVSRHHALFVRNGKATLLMDLNSSNGTFVNSRRISNQVMINDDIITIGQHGIKFVDPAATDRAALEGGGFSDTIVMKSLEDMRRILARENTQMLPVADDKKASTNGVE